MCVNGCRKLWKEMRLPWQAMGRSWADDAQRTSCFSRNRSSCRCAVLAIRCVFTSASAIFLLAFAISAWRTVANVVRRGGHLREDEFSIIGAFDLLAFFWKRLRDGHNAVVRGKEGSVPLEVRCGSRATQRRSLPVFARGAPDCGRPRTAQN